MMPKKFYRQGMKSKVSNSNYFLIEAKSRSEDGNGIREENKSNNFVVKKEKTHKVVGLGTIRLWIDSKLFYAVRYNPLSGFQKSCRFGHISPGVFECIDDQFFLVVLNCPFKGEGRNCTGLFSGLKGRRKMVAVDNTIRTKKDSSLDAILEFSHITWPVVLNEHVNGRS